MLCERCNKREAILNLSKIINGESTSLWLCEICVEKYGHEMFSDDSDSKEDSVSFNKVLSILFEGEGKKNKKSKIECGNCGRRLIELEKGKLLGCEECYKTFTSDINKIVQKENLFNEHRGEVPNRLGEEIRIKREIANLEKEMDIAVAIEAYEKAAKLRDEIKELKKKWTTIKEE